VLYEVRVEGRGSFEHECEQPLEAGDLITPFTMLYEVTAILPGSGKFDGVAQAVWRGGPGQVAE